MDLRAYTPFLIGLVVLVAVLRMPLMLATPMHHEIGCPFAMGQAALCATSVLEHVRHWQIAFASILAQLLVIAALALITLREWQRLVLPDRSFARVRLRPRAPDRPTLFQELFSRGILNRKEPYAFS